MRNLEKDAVEMAARREAMLETGFRLFSEQSIDAVSMSTVADTCGLGIATLYRYFNTKLIFVIAVGTRQWELYHREAIERWNARECEQMTAAQALEAYLDGFIRLYRERRDLLRFNQFFNIYVMQERATAEQLKPYLDITNKFGGLFQSIYRRAMEDGTLRTELPVNKLFAASVHLMLAAATRYAVGLVYLPEEAGDPVEELILLKTMILNTFRTGNDMP